MLRLATSKHDDTIKTGFADAAVVPFGVCPIARSATVPVGHCNPAAAHG
jgi:hypothetical protein